MRGLRSTLALLVVLVGLAAYIYFVVSKKTDDTASKQEKLFAALDATAIDGLTVKSESGDVTTVKKTGGAWRIVAPVDVPAAEIETTGITNALADIDVVRVVDEAPADVKEYGLDVPRLQVDFTSSDGKSKGRLLVGEKTATGGSLYARRDDQKRVVLIGQYHEGTLNKTTFDLRDKAIVKFDRTKVDGVDVDLAGKAMAFTKSGADWRMTRPQVVRTDFSAVDGLVGHLEALQMKSIVSSNPTPADLKRFGLDRPQETIRVHLGSSQASVAIGGKSETATVYVRDASRPDVFEVESSAVEDLKKPANDFRKKELFDARAFNITRIELTRSGQTTVFERVKAKTTSEPDTWHRSSPNPGDPAREKVEGFLAGLGDIRATSFVDSTAGTGLNSPTLTVVKFDEGQKEERVAFGRNGANVFGSRPDDVGAAKIESGKFDETIKALDEISK